MAELLTSMQNYVRCTPNSMQNYIRSTLNSTQSHVVLALKRRFYINSMHTEPKLHNFAFFSVDI